MGLNASISVSDWLHHTPVFRKPGNDPDFCFHASS
jgi:hypothetical protein